MEAVKKHKEEERQKKRELAKQEKQKKMEEKKGSKISMGALVSIFCSLILRNLSLTG